MRIRKQFYSTSFPGCINIILPCLCIQGRISLFMHPGKDYVYASREEGQAERGPECPNLRVLSCRLINHTREYDLLAEYMRRFHENINRVWVKTSEYGGKITQIFKRVYSFNRDLRVHTAAFKSNHCDRQLCYEMAYFLCCQIGSKYIAMPLYTYLLFRN